MEVGHCLSPLPPAVYYQAVALLKDAFPFSQSVGDGYHLSYKGCLLGAEPGEGGDVFFGHNRMWMGARGWMSRMAKTFSS